MLAWILVLYSEELFCQNILSQLRGCLSGQAQSDSSRSLQVRHWRWEKVLLQPMEELKQVDEDGVLLLFWWKGKWGEGALWEIELRLGALRLETWAGCFMHIWRCNIFDSAFKCFTSRHHNSWGDLRHSARWLEVSSCKVIMSLSATLHVAV